MLKRRLIPVLILREGMVVQSVQFKHTNVIHWKPLTAVDFFNRWAVDEIIILDVTRNKKKRRKCKGLGIQRRGPIFVRDGSSVQR